MLFAPKILKNSLLLLDGKHKKHYLNERERERDLSGKRKNIKYIRYIVT